MSGELALMLRSNALAGVNLALGVSVGSRQLTLSLAEICRQVLRRRCETRSVDPSKQKQTTNNNNKQTTLTRAGSAIKRGVEAREVSIENHRYLIWFSRGQHHPFKYRLREFIAGVIASRKTGDQQQ